VPRLGVKSFGSSEGIHGVVQRGADRQGSIFRQPREELKGFRRITLEPRGTKTVEIQLKASDLAYWDEGLSSFKVEAEPVEVMVGSSSADIKASTTIKVQ
jgi:beta-glucosidase